MSRIDVAVNIHLDRRIERDNAESAYYLCMVGDFLRAKEHFILISGYVGEKFIPVLLSQGKGACRNKVDNSAFNQ